MLQMFKRVEGMYLYVRGESTGTLDLSVKRDNETDWQTIGSVDITGDEPIKEIYVGPDVLDHIAKHFLWKFSADNRFRFFGVIFEYILCGERNR
jgi:hypothetical protein